MASYNVRGGLDRALPLLAVALGLVFILSVGVAVGPGGPGGPVALATQSDEGCFLANTTGMLVSDATAGTAIVQEDMGKLTAQVLWPTGYTARRNGGVEVLDRAGHVVARTGQRYELLGGYNDADQWIACDGGVYPPLWPSPR